MAEKKYLIIEYKEFPKRTLKNGYYPVNRVKCDIETNPEWWANQSTETNMLVEYGYIVTSDGVKHHWGYVEDKDGAPTIVILPDLNVKIPSKDVWILPLITSQL